MSDSAADLTPALSLIRKFEGLRLKAYRDPVGIWTIGYGTTAGVVGGMVITEAQAEALLLEEAEHCAASIAHMVKVPLNSNELCALVSFVYNLGAGNLKKSTLLRKLNADAPRAEVASEFLKWNKAGGKVLLGLVRRRQAEYELFRSAELNLSLA